MYLTGWGASFRKAVQYFGLFSVSSGKTDGLHRVWVAVCERRAERSHNQLPSTNPPPSAQITAYAHNICKQYLQVVHISF